MKRTRLLFAIALLPCLAAPAFAADGFTVGGGLNSSFMDSDAEGVTYSHRLGFNLGIGYEKEISPRFSIMPELNLETRGEIAEVEDTFVGDMTSRLKLLYLQILVFLMVKAPIGEATFNAFAGPALGILLSARTELEVNGEEAESDFKDEMRPFDLGVEMGAGIEFPAASGSFFIRPSYYLGLMNVEDSEQEGPFRLRNIKLKAGYEFPL